MENLNSSSKPALMELARQHNIRGRSTMNKAQLISALTPLVPRRATTPPSSSSSTSSATIRRRCRHTVVIKFVPEFIGNYRHSSPQPKDHMDFLGNWFRRNIQFYIDNLNDEIGDPVNEDDPDSPLDCRLDGLYGSSRTGKMYVKLSYTGQRISSERLIGNEESDRTPIMDHVLDPDEDGNDPLIIIPEIRRGRATHAQSETYLIRGNNEMEIVDNIPSDAVQRGGSGNINMTELTNALTPIPDRQFELAIKIENAAKGKRGISKGLLAKAHELRTRVMNDTEFIQLENYIHMIIGKSKLPTIKESSSSKKLGKRGRKSSNSNDSTGHDKYGRVRTYQTLEGGAGAFNMDEMNAALAIPVEQLKLADDIHKNIFLADPAIRGGLQKIADKLRVTPMKPEQFIQLKAQVKKIIGKYGSESDSEQETSESSSSSRKKRHATSKRKRMS